MSSKGFGLFEVFIAISLSSLISIMLITLFLTLKRQEVNARYTIEKELNVNSIVNLMRDLIRHAGFTPCINLELLDSRDLQSKKIKAIEIIHNLEKIAVKTRKMDTNFNLIYRIQNNELIASTDTPISSKYPVIISDCYHAEVNTVSQIMSYKNNLQKIQLTNPLHFRYSSSAFIGEFKEEEFFVKNLQNAFYYKSHHTDIVSNIIKSIKIRSILNSLYRIELELKNKNSLIFDVKVRML